MPTFDVDSIVDSLEGKISFSKDLLISNSKLKKGEVVLSLEEEREI
jgi:hypothetical protein